MSALSHGQLVPHPEAAPLPAREFAEPLLASAAAVETPVGNPAATAALASEGAAEALAGDDSVGSCACLDEVLRLSKTIREPSRDVGQTDFLIFALLRTRRVFMWQEPSRIDLRKAYLPPWADETLTQHAEVDAVVRKGIREDSGVPLWAPVSEKHPVGTWQHYVSAVFTGEIEEAGGHGLR